MVVTEKNESKQDSNFNLSNTSSNAKYNSYEQQHDTNLQDQNRNNFIEKNYLLPDVNKVKPEILAEENHIKMQKINGFKKENDDKKLSDPEIGPINGENEPPDGGVRAWAIMIASFVINGILFSVINSYSTIYDDLKVRFNGLGVSNYESKAALVGALQLGTTFGMSPVTGYLTAKIGIRMTTFLGGLIASLGMFISAFMLDRVECLFLTLGIMYGIGGSLAYAPSLVILGHYFKRYLGVVNGIVAAGSSVFTTLMPYVMKFTIENYGLKTLIVCLGIFTSFIMSCGLLFKPIPLQASPVVEKPKITHNTTICEKFNSIIDSSVLRNKTYIIWAVSIPIALLGYSVPYIHVGTFVEERFTNSSKTFPITCIGISSAIGRLIFGYIADFPKINKIFLQQIAFTCLGGLVMLLSVTSSYSMLVIIYLGIGFFEGCFISLLGPIAFEISGKEHATAAISLLLGLCAIPVTTGLTFATYLHEETGSYPLTFLISGVPPIFASLIMFAVRCVKDDKVSDSVDPAIVSLTGPVWQNDSTKSTSEKPAITGVKTEEKELQIHDNGPTSVLA